MKLHDPVPPPSSSQSQPVAHSYCSVVSSTSSPPSTIPPGSFTASQTTSFFLFGFSADGFFNFPDIPQTHEPSGPFTSVPLDPSFVHGELSQIHRSMDQLFANSALRSNLFQQLSTNSIHQRQQLTYLTDQLQLLFTAL